MAREQMRFQQLLKNVKRFGFTNVNTQRNMLMITDFGYGLVETM